MCIYPEVFNLLTFKNLESSQLTEKWNPAVRSGDKGGTATEGSFARREHSLASKFTFHSSLKNYTHSPTLPGQLLSI
jgi:hypothetical protein